jgi:RimJ/RimL family protein N-acetyltransferase
VPEPADDLAAFSVVRLADQELAGAALLWGIDTHHRCAHLGLALRPAFRGAGLGSDVVRVLCYYGFVVRGLHRLSVETLADNDGMMRAATRSGFQHEGTLRRAAWVTGEFVDEVVFGLLVEEWRARQQASG